MYACRTFRKALQPGGFLYGLATGILITLAIFLFPFPFSNQDPVLREKVTLFDFILHDINTSYVDNVDISKLFETGVNSMLATLDPYTQFENNAQAMEMSVKTNGKYAGVGLGISLETDPPNSNNKHIVVVSAFEGYAYDAGIRPGDVLHTVATHPVSGQSLEKVTDMLRGQPGTTVDVSVIRQGYPQPISFTLSRKDVRIKDVPAATFVGTPDDAIAYVRLQSFAKDAAPEVQAAVEKLSAQRPLKALILDLRGNPGGLLNAAIEVSELFLPKDSTIVSTKGRGLGPAPLYRSSRDPLLPPNVRIAVLVDGQTASASEIVAGALQDLDYGVIIGSRTFGKGLVQNVQELPFNTALKYTVGKYYTPSGRCIQALNYEQVDGDGPLMAKKVEEGQRKEFKTRVGRVVRDGGGIEPDVLVDRRLSFLDSALHRQNMYFRFANQYAANSKLNDLPPDFCVTDALYKEFVRFVTDSEFKYESRFDNTFDQLDEMFKEVGYDSARGRVKDLKKATASEMKSDFQRHEQDVRWQLESAIRYRLQPDSERIIAELKSDDHLEEAIRVVKDGDSFGKLLLASADNGGSDNNINNNNNNNNSNNNIISGSGDSNKR